MRRFVLFVVSIFALSLDACSSSLQTAVQYGPDPDPVAMAMNLPPSLEPTEGHSCDIGIAIRRRSGLDGLQDPDNSHNAAIDFASNGMIVRVDSASVNGVELPWIDSSLGAFPAYSYGIFDPRIYGNPDSAIIAYQGFNGDSFSTKVDIAPSFGKVMVPDTISASKGCVIKYEGYGTGDSIYFAISSYDDGDLQLTRPDSGVIVLLPHQLPYDSGTGEFGYVFSMLRTHWSVRTSTRGNKMGVWSLMESDSWLVPAKP